MAEKELKRLGILSVAALGAIFGMLWGIVIGITAYLVGGAYLPLRMPPIELVLYIGAGGGAGGGFIGGAITAILYNLLARTIGGIKFEVG